MIIYTKYSNERRREFCIQTDIEMDAGGRKTVCKRAAFPEAEAHVRGIEEKYRRLEADLAETGLGLNVCTAEAPDVVRFPFLEGRTLEEKLDELLDAKQEKALLEEISRYFSMFEGGPDVFCATEKFHSVFGEAGFSREQKCRRVSDIDMIFANAIENEEGYVLIDYEWTFDFPIPVRYLKYRCLYYYILGNAKRDELVHQNLYELFDISAEECRIFAEMERNFQKYILGDYTPIWKLYDDISDGVIPVVPMVEEASAVQRAMHTAEVYFDDGSGFSTKNWKKYQVEPKGEVSLRIELPEGTRAVRIDPCAAKSIVRISALTQAGTELDYRINGEKSPGGDCIFDTEDPQLIIENLPHGNAPVEIRYSAEMISGLTREVILNQNGRIRWMEQTKAWKLYRKLRGNARI